MPEESSKDRGEEKLSRSQRALGRVVGEWKPKEFEPTEKKKAPSGFVGGADEGVDIQLVAQLRQVYEWARDRKIFGEPMDELLKEAGEELEIPADERGLLKDDVLTERLSGKDFVVKEKALFEKVPQLLNDLIVENRLEEFVDSISKSMKVVINRQGEVDLKKLFGGLLKTSLKTTDGGEIDTVEAMIWSKWEEEGVFRDEVDEELLKELGIDGKAKASWEKLSSKDRQLVTWMRRVLELADIDIASLKEKRWRKASRVSIDLSTKELKETELSLTDKYDERKTNERRRRLWQAKCAKDKKWSVSVDLRLSLSWESLTEEQKEVLKIGLKEKRDSELESKWDDFARDEKVEFLDSLRWDFLDKGSQRKLGTEIGVGEAKRSWGKLSKEQQQFFIDQYKAHHKGELPKDAKKEWDELAIKNRRFLLGWQRWESLSLEERKMKKIELSQLEWESLKEDERRQRLGELEFLEEASEKLRVSLEDLIKGTLVYHNIDDPDQIKNVFSAKGFGEMLPGLMWGHKPRLLQTLVKENIEQMMAEVAEAYMEEETWSDPRKFIGFNIEGDAPGVLIENFAVDSDRHYALLQGLRMGGNYEKWRAIATIRGLNMWSEGLTHEKVRTEPLKGAAAVYFAIVGHASNIKAMYEMIPDFAYVKNYQEWQGFVSSETEQPIYEEKKPIGPKGFGIEWVEGTRDHIREGKLKLASRFGLEIVWNEKKRVYEEQPKNESLVGKDYEEQFYITKDEKVVGRERVEMSRSHPDENERTVEALVLQDKDGKKKRRVIGNNGVFLAKGIEQIKEVLTERARYEGVWMPELMVELAWMSHRMELSGIDKPFGFSKVDRPDRALTLLDIASGELPGWRKMEWFGEELLGLADEGLEILRDIQSKGELDAFHSWLGEVEDAMVEQKIEEELRETELSGEEEAKRKIEIRRGLNLREQWEAFWDEQAGFQTGLMSWWGVTTGGLDNNPENRMQRSKLALHGRPPRFTKSRDPKLENERKRRGIYDWVGLKWMNSKVGKDIQEVVGPLATGGAWPFDRKNRAHMGALLEYLNPKDKDEQDLKDEDKQVKKVLLEAGIVGRVSEEDIDKIFTPFLVEVLEGFNQHYGYTMKLGEMDFGIVRTEMLRYFQESLRMIGDGGEAGTRGRERLRVAGLSRLDISLCLRGDAEATELMNNKADQWMKIVRLEKALETDELWRLDFSYVEEGTRLINKKFEEDLEKLIARGRGSYDQLIYKMIYYYATYSACVTLFNELRRGKKIVPTAEAMKALQAGPFLDQPAADLMGLPYAGILQFFNERHEVWLIKKIENNEIITVPQLEAELEKSRQWEHHYEKFLQDEFGFAITNPKEWEEIAVEKREWRKNFLIWKLTSQQIMNLGREPLQVGQLHELFRPDGKHQLGKVIAISDENRQIVDFLKPGDWGYEEQLELLQEWLNEGASLLEEASMLEYFETKAEFGEPYKTQMIKLHISGWKKTEVKRVWWGLLENYISVPSSIKMLRDELAELSENVWVRAESGKYELPWFLREWMKEYWKFEDGTMKIDITEHSDQAAQAREFLKELLYKDGELKSEGFEFLIAAALLVEVDGSSGGVKRQMRGTYFSRHKSIPSVMFRRYTDPLIDKTHPFSEELRGKFKIWYKKLCENPGISEVLKKYDHTHLINPEAVYRVIQRKLDQDPFFSRKKTEFYRHVKQLYSFQLSPEDEGFSIIHEIVGYPESTGLKGSLLEQARQRGGFDTLRLLEAMMMQESDKGLESEFTKGELAAFRGYLTFKATQRANPEIGLDKETELKLCEGLNNFVRKGVGWNFGLRRKERKKRVKEIKKERRWFFKRPRKEEVGWGEGESFKLNMMGALFKKRWNDRKQKRLAVRVMKKHGREVVDGGIQPLFTSIEAFENRVVQRLPEEKMMELWFYAEFGIVLKNLDRDELNNPEYLKKRLEKRGVPKDWTKFKDKFLAPKFRPKKIFESRWDLGVRNLLQGIYEIPGAIDRFRQFRWVRDKGFGTGMPIYNYMQDRLELKYLATISFTGREEGLWWRGKWVSQEALFNDMVTLFIDPDPFLNRITKSKLYLQLKDKMPQESINQDLLDRLAFIMFGTGQRPQEYITNFMLDLEHKTFPVLSAIPRMVFKIVGGLGVSVVEPELDWISKYFEPPLGMVIPAGVVAALGYSRAALAMFIPTLIVAAQPFLIAGGIGFGISMGIQIGTIAYEKAKEKALQKGEEVSEGWLRRRGVGAGLATGLGIAVIAGTMAAVAPVSMVGWLLVSWTGKALMMGINKGLAKLKIMKYMERDPYLQLSKHRKG